MAAQDDGDDFFSDHDLDALPQNDLDALEKNALQYTQHQTQATLIIECPPSSDYGGAFEDEDLDDAVVFDEALGLPDRVRSLQLPNASLTTQREQFHQGHYGAPRNPNSLKNQPLEEELSPSTLPVQDHMPEELPQNGSSRRLQLELPAQAVSDPNVEALQRQIQELLRERDILKQDINAKAGEIAIVRSKQEKSAKEFERQLTSVRKLNAEKLADYQKAIEAAKDAEKKAATELEFAKRDLLEEAEKARNLRRAQEKGKENIGEPITTPKKNKTAVYRDGFDDDEIQVISPPKFRPKRSNPSTPTKAGIKRKRKGPESPIVPLQVTLDDLPQEKAAQPPAIILNEVLLERIRRPDDRLNFLEAVFDHRPYRDHLRTFEEFSKLAFPSTPEASFASIVLGKLPTLSLKQSTSNFPVQFCELIISLWERCLAEKYYKPIYLLIDLLTFCLELKTLTIAPFIIDTLLPVAQLTAELIAVPRFIREAVVELEKDIDVSACLGIIHLAALGCMDDKEHIKRVWQIIRLDFVLVILSQHQPVKDFDMMLQLLSMSTMKDSLGPKTSDQDEQQGRASYIIDRVSLLLINSPTVPEGAAKHDLSIISNLRLQILRTLGAFCQTAWGGEVMAMHKQAIGRLVKLMSDELDALYNYRSGHKQSAQLISLTTRLLHHLTTKHEKHINMQEKLSGIHGGNQKYLICLARLNFSEGDLVLDADIEPEIAECAHEMLELAVTPEEGDAIHSAFSSS